MVRANYTIHEKYPVKVYNNNNELIYEGTNIYIYNDLLLQIAEEKATGYYLISECKKYVILPNGTIWGNTPPRLFSLIEKQLSKLKFYTL